MKMPINCPNTWLNGSKHRNRNGWTSRSHFAYLLNSISIGLRFASRLRCVRHTPFGSAVVPEVKTIWTRSSGLICSGAYGEDEWWAIELSRFVKESFGI